MLSGEQRFGFTNKLDSPGFQIDVCDYDQRLIVRVVLPPPGENPNLDSVRQGLPTTEALAIDIARRHLDGETLDQGEYAGVEIGDVISLSGERFSLSHFEPAPHVDTISRSDLTELGRFKRGVDLCSYTEGSTEKKVVIKYPCFPVQGVSDYWNELNVMLRLPPAPCFLHVDRLIVDENDPSSVVGFTTPYVEGSDLGREWQGREFKIEWMRQLIDAVDMLNLQYGIVHQDLAGRNFLLDRKEDRIILCDFHLAARVQDATDPEQDDVKGLLLAVHDLITHDIRYFARGLWELNKEELTKEWEQHPEVILNADVAAYKKEIVEWVDRRRSAEGQNYKPRQQIDWPRVPSPSSLPGTDRDFWFSHKRMPGSPSGCDYYELMKRRENGAVVLEWRRPAALKIDGTRRLLATGQYAEEESD